MSLVAAGNRWILAESRRLRLSTLFILYVAQGVPLGLFWFAIPSWMAANGATPADIGYVLGLTTLPWTLKLVNGFIMDRYTFLAMGRRRIWIIGAQMVMIALLAGCALIGPGVTDIFLLGMAGFVVNMATTFQDVAVDGMAVDIMEEEERARASGMMFGGQSIGIASATALSGLAIARLGPSAAYLLAASAIGAITLYMLLLTERAGERLVPWSAGDAHPRNRLIHVGAWLPILKSTVVSMIRPVSLFWLPVLLVRGFHYGMFTAVTPLIGTGNVGWSEVQVTSVVGTAQFVAGILGLTLGGWLGDTFGAKKSTIAMFAALMAVSATMWFSVAAWGDADELHRLRLRLVRAGRADHCRGSADIHAVVRPACRRDPVHALHGDQQFRDQPRGVGAPLQQADERVTDDVRAGICAAPGRPAADGAGQISPEDCRGGRDRRAAGRECGA